MQNKIYLAALTLILGGYFFNVKLWFLDFGTLYLSAFAIVGFGIVGCINYEKLNRKLAIVVAPLYLAVVTASISIVVNLPDVDYFLVGALFFLATVCLFSFGFFKLFSKVKGQPLLVAVIAALCLNSGLMLLMFISPGAQHSYLAILREEGLELFGGTANALESMHRFRMIGATGFSTYSAGFAQSIGLFFLAVYYYLARRKPDLLFLALALLLAVSAILAARSSFLGIFLWIIFCFIFFRRRFVPVFSYASVLLVIIIYALIVFTSTDSDDFFSKWLLELFTSGTSSESLAETVQMLDTPFMDSGLYGFSRWYGDLGYDYFRSADVGFIRLILAGGFASLFFVVLHFLMLGFIFFRGTDIVFFRTLYCFLIVYFSAVMFKGAILFDFFAFDFLMLMLAWIANQNKDIVKIK